MKKLVIIFLLSMTVVRAQTYVKIDSLGYNLTNNVIEIPNQEVNEIYQKTIDYINQSFENPDKVIKAKTENKYLRLEYVDYYMAFVKRTGIKTNIGGKVSFEFDFKDNKIRVRSFVPTLYVLPDNVSSRLPFEIKGGMMTNSLYSNKLKPKKEMVKNKVKEQLEMYFDDQINKLVNFIKGTSEVNNDDW